MMARGINFQNNAVFDAGLTIFYQMTVDKRLSVFLRQNSNLEAVFQRSL